MIAFERTDYKINNNEAVAIATNQKMGSKTGIMDNTDQNVGSAFEKYRALLVEAGITKIYISNIEHIYQCIGQDVIRQSDVMEYLGCSKSRRLSF